MELASGENDWIEARGCFVRAFQNYPLYSHLIPNEDRRSEFLTQYLEAIYDVLIRNGDSVLVCVKLNLQSQNGSLIPTVSCRLIRNNFPHHYINPAL